MAVKLIAQMSHAAFIEYVRTATELEAWAAIGDAWYFVRHARVTKVMRSSCRRTVEEAEVTYKHTFGKAWVPF